jgi:hypothetical protein
VTTTSAALRNQEEAMAKATIAMAAATTQALGMDLVGRLVGMTMVLLTRTLRMEVDAVVIMIIRCMSRPSIAMPCYKL